MILGVDGPVVVLRPRVAALLARGLERLVADAHRRREPVDPEVIAAVADCERVRRLLVTQAAVPAPEPAEPDFAEPGAKCPGDPDLSTSEAAEWLAVSPSYLRRLARERRLGRKVGTAWRFPVAELVMHGDRDHGRAVER